MTKFRNINPFIYEKTKDGEVFQDIYSRLAKEGVIFLSDDVTQEIAGIIVSMMFLMDKDRNNEIPIEFWINTDGGDVDAFFAIYDMMNLIKSPIQTICVGKAYSAGALLLSAGTKGMRYCLPNSHVMIHQIQVDGVGGTGTEIAINAKEVKKINDKIIDILARNTGQYASKVKRDIEHDTYLDAEDAVQYGIVDKILLPSKKIPDLKKRKTGSKKDSESE